MYLLRQFVWQAFACILVTVTFPMAHAASVSISNLCPGVPAHAGELLISTAREEILPLLNAPPPDLREKAESAARALHRQFSTYDRGVVDLTAGSIFCTALNEERGLTSEQKLERWLDFARGLARAAAGRTGVIGGGVRPKSVVALTDTYLAELARANVALATPERMVQGDTASVVLWLDPTEKLTSLLDELRATVGIGSKVEGAAAIRYAPKMRASLTGPGFDVTPQGSIVQAMSAKERTEWTWQAQAKSTGKQRLHMTLEAIVPSPGGESSRILKTFERDIDVQVTAGSFIQKNWQWLAGTLVIPLIAWMWKQRHSDQKRPNSAS